MITSLIYKKSWVPTIKNSVRTGFKDAGKGWFNMQESNMEVYKISKLKKFMTGLKFMMQDSLRFLVLNSLNDFLKMISSVTSQTILISGTNDVRVIDGNSKIIGHNLEQSTKKPIFALDLVFRNGKVVYNTDPRVFENVLVSILEKGISSADGLPDLEPAVLDRIFWVSKPMLETVNVQEPAITQVIQKIRSCFRDSLSSLEKYLRQYDKHLKLLNLDINQFAIEYEAENKSIEEMEQDIVKHLQDWEALEKDIPSHINLGLFYVGCDSIRSAIRKDLSKVILDIIAKKTSKMVSSVTQNFMTAQARLKEKPSKIEELVELREYMKTVPDVIKQQQIKIQDTLKNYDTLERYRYECSNEDFRAKWTAYGWPLKTEELLKTTEVSLEAEENSFKARLSADQEVFKDRINTLNTLISDFSKNSDITIINEIAPESEKISNEIKECQQLVTLFNSRERLFGNEPTVYDEVAQAAKEFEPYKNLWMTTADWLKWKDAWTLGSFIDLNAEEVEKNLNNSYKIVFKCLKQFKNQPGCFAVASQVVLLFA